MVGPYLGMPDPFPAYLDGAHRALIDGRACGALRWDPDRGPEQVTDLVERRGSAADAGLRMRHVKIMVDGICENRTAALHAQYSNGDPHLPAGICALEPDQPATAIAVLERHGFGAHLHAVGDRAVRQCLDAIAAARRPRGRTATGPATRPRTCKWWVRLTSHASASSASPPPSNRCGPPPGARTRPAGSTPPSSSRAPFATVSGCTPVAWATAVIPPRPSSATSAASTRQLCRSSRYGRSTA